MIPDSRSAFSLVVSFERTSSTSIGFMGVCSRDSDITMQFLALTEQYETLSTETG